MCKLLLCVLSSQMMDFTQLLQLQTGKYTVSDKCVEQQTISNELPYPGSDFLCSILRLREQIYEICYLLAPAAADP